jgi:hypothetical protein
MKIIFEKYNKPVSDKWIIRILLLLVILLSLSTGFYHSLLKAGNKKYLKLEDLYVRVRSELGRKETQRLIDLSRIKQKSN